MATNLKLFRVFTHKGEFLTMAASSKLRARWVGADYMASQKQLPLDGFTYLLASIMATEITPFEVKGWGNYLGEVG